MPHILRFFFSLQDTVYFICCLFYSCNIHILNTGCAKILKENSGAKGLTTKQSFVHQHFQRMFLLSRTRWLKEVGLVDRENKRWFPQRPKCDSLIQGFVSVRLKDFYPTLVVLSTGILCSVTFLLMELIIHKRRYSTFWPTDDHTAAAEP